jgi:hypothetical protein
MTFAHRLLPALAAVLALSCGSDPAAPAGAVTAHWGAQNIGFASTSTASSLQLPCALPITIGAPVVPDAAGAFTLPTTRVPQPGTASYTVGVSGRITGQTLMLHTVITPENPASDQAIDDWVLTLNADPVFTLLCTQS